jgi:hypothetical protein
MFHQNPLTRATYQSDFEKSAKCAQSCREAEDEVERKAMADDAETNYLLQAGSAT